MAYNGSMKTIWGRGTAADGNLFRDEYQRIYDNFNEFINTAGDEIHVNNVKADTINEKTPDNGVTIEGVLLKDGDIQGGVPVGTIIAWLPGYFADGNNGTYTGVSLTLPDWWKECDGSPLNDAVSPIFNGAGRYLPNLTDSRFLMGNTSGNSGAIGGSNDAIAHTHAFTQPSNHSNHVFTQPSAHGITQPTFTYPNHQHQVGEIVTNIVRMYNINGDPYEIIRNNYATTGMGTVIASVTLSGATFYSKIGGGGSCIRTTDVALTNNHSGGAVDAHSAHTGGSVNAVNESITNANIPKYLSVRYIMRIK